MLKYETEKVMGEAFYSYYPNYIKINNAIWTFFESKEHLWLYDLKKMAKELKIDLAIVLGYLKLLSEQNPSLLIQAFYQSKTETQIQLIDSVVLEIIAKTQISSFSEQAERGFNNWVKTVFVCWQPTDKQLKDFLDIKTSNSDSFKPDNSLASVLK